MYFRTHIITLLSLTILCSTVSAQNVKYVTDQLQAPVRASANESSRITKMLTSGEKIKILNENKQHYEIQYGDNNAHGWIHKSFVMNDPAAREFVEMAKQEYAPLQDSITTLNKENDEKDNIILALQENQKKLEQALLVQTNRVTHLEQINKNVIDIDNDNQLLTQINMQQELELKQLKSENFTLKENKRSDEWLKGASILFAGIVLGTSILPRLLRYRNQKRSWGRY